MKKLTTDFAPDAAQLKIGHRAAATKRNGNGTVAFLRTSGKGGRPNRAEAAKRLERLLSIAERHFLAAGYSETSLESIAREAGVAKKTLYHHFGGKDGLFAIILDALCNSWIEELKQIAVASEEPRTVLEAVATRLLDVATRPQMVELQRLLLTDAHHLPAVVRSKYTRTGALRGMEPLSRYLRATAKAGRVRIDDSGLAAEQFTFLVLGGIRERLLHGAARPDARQRGRIARQAVRLFLTGCQIAGR